MGSVIRCQDTRMTGVLGCSEIRVVSVRCVDDVEKQYLGDKVSSSSSRFADPGVEKTACSLCCKTFRSSRLLASHKCGGLYTCRVCTKVFITSGDLAKHIQRQHECDICHSMFPRENLRSHMRTHAGEKRFECGVCHKRFTYCGVLNRHVACHTGERQYSCYVCQKRFVKLTHLKIHMHTHGGQKPY